MSTVGTALLPTFKKILTGLGDFFYNLNNFAEAHPRLIQMGVGLVALSATLLAVGAAVQITRAAFMGLGIIFTAIKTAAAGFQVVTRVGAIMAAVSAASIPLAPILAGVVIGIGAVMLVSRNWTAIITTLKANLDNVKIATALLLSVMDKLGGVIMRVARQIGGVLGAIGGNLAEMGKYAFDLTGTGGMGQAAPAPAAAPGLPKAMATDWANKVIAKHGMKDAFDALSKYNPEAVAASAADIPFSIGSFDFSQEDVFVTPDGNTGGISDLGGVQAHAINEFQGGLRTAQLFGAFPTMIEIKGIFFGTNALTRVKALDGLRTQGQGVTLTYGPYSFYGFVAKCKIISNYQFEVHYELSFIPLSDNTAQGSATAQGNNASQTTLSNAQNTMNQQSSAPAAPTAIPAPIQTSVLNFNNALNSALTSAGGQVSNLTPTQTSSLQSQASSISDSLQDIIDGSDPIAASAASDLQGSVNAISNSLNTNQEILASIPVINPNLFALATQYYGNPNLWTLITSANNLPNESFAIGDFTNLIIPANNQAAPVSTPPTVLNFPTA
ncbi:unnamed protein product [Sphagnum compactum]